MHVGTKGDVRCPVCVSTFVFIQPDPCCLCVLSFSSRTEGCRIDGSICYKDSVDCSWSVALGQGGSQDGRQIWALKVGGRTGRMAVGVALDVDEVGYCYHRVMTTGPTRTLVTSCNVPRLILHQCCCAIATQVLKAPGGWTACECENKVWYYTSTGAVRSGPTSIAGGCHLAHTNDAQNIAYSILNISYIFICRLGAQIW